MTISFQLPSIVRAIELITAANINLRYITCISLSFRIFIAICYRNLFIFHRNIRKYSFILSLFSSILAIAHCFEVICLAAITIITIRYDFKGTNNLNCYFYICFN